MSSGRGRHSKRCCDAAVRRLSVAPPKKVKVKLKTIPAACQVSFSPGSETMSMHQLSGGQRTLVSLALILAIQRCDPAPFYLFDEVDAALDPQYRTSVAAILRRQANDARNPAQFIVTTFHPQLVMEADRLYGVSHTNRVSQVGIWERLPSSVIV